MQASTITRLLFIHQKENKATQSGGLILFHCIQRILNSGSILETKMVICCLLPKSCMWWGRGQMWKEVRDEAWKLET